MFIPFLNYAFCPFVRKNDIGKDVRQLKAINKKIRDYAKKTSQPSFEHISKDVRLADKIHFIACIREKKNLEKKIQSYQ